MAFREVSVIQIKEVLRRWLRDDGGVRSIATAAGVDRKTARRYIEAAVALGLERDGGESQLTDELVGGICEAVRPSRPNGHGSSWELLSTHEVDIKAWVVKGLTVAKIGDLLVRRGVIVPERTLQRFCAEQCGAGRQGPTVRVADGEPGKELQCDFGRMGMIFDPRTERRRVVHALIVVAVWSRFMYVWLTFGQRTDDVIAGLDAAWAFFGGVFSILIPDNLSPVVTKANPTEPRFNDTFLEYAQDRGFLIDPARVRRPKDKPRVERQVPYVRNRFFVGEDFVDLDDGQRRVEKWCNDDAGMRIHGTTRCRPKEAFVANEKGLLLPAPLAAYDVPVFSDPKVHRDHHLLTELTHITSLVDPPIEKLAVLDRMTNEQADGHPWSIGVDGRAPGRTARGDRRPIRPLSPRRTRRDGRRSRDDLLSTPARRGPFAGDAAVLRDGPVAVVPLLLGHGSRLGPSGSDERARVLHLVAGGAKTAPVALAPRRCGRRGRPGLQVPRPVLACRACAQRDRAAQLLRLSP